MAQTIWFMTLRRCFVLIVNSLISPRTRGQGLLRRRSQQSDFVQTQAIAAAGRVDLEIHAVPAGAEVRGVTQPEGAAIRADELGGEFEEIRLLPEILQLGRHPINPRGFDPAVVKADVSATEIVRVNDHNVGRFRGTDGCQRHRKGEQHRGEARRRAGWGGMHFHTTENSLSRLMRMRGCSAVGERWKWGCRSGYLYACLVAMGT